MKLLTATASVSLLLSLFFGYVLSFTPLAPLNFLGERRSASYSSTILSETISVVSDELEKKTVAELKAELKSRGLPVSGTKPILIQRLVDFYESLTLEDTSEEQEALNYDDKPNSTLTDSDGITIVSSPDQDSIISLLPRPILETFSRRIGKEENSPTLLPVQERAYKAIASGSDAVLFAPTGSGKTLAYVLPIFTRLFEWKKSGSLKKQERRLTQKEYFEAKRNKDPACPAILVMAPSRELAKQIGSVCSQYHPTSSGRVVTVFGGVPVERHAALLRKEVDVVVGTPGRIRELIRDKLLSTANVKSIILDEADMLLNFEDQPEIEMLLNGMQEDYQLVLASATINKRVKEFVEDVMEIDETSDSFIVVDGAGVDKNTIGSSSEKAQGGRPTVSHWFTAATSSARANLASDIMATLSPRTGIVFVASKAEVDAVAEEISNRLNEVKVSVLHGDMPQSARSRTISSLREKSSNRPNILVATDVASRGLDLPGVDLVLQFGIPRISGKEGTYNSELYTHRAGRAGRVGGGSRSADVILLYDPAEGEGKVLPKLQEELDEVGINLKPRPLPTPEDVMEASYERASRACSEITEQSTFVKFFRNKIISELTELPDSYNKEEILLEKLAACMAALSGLGGKVPERSLLTADSTSRTVRVWSEDGDTLNPSEVTRYVKGLGSGKLGRVTICEDGAAVFDLPTKRAMKLFTAAKESNGIVEGADSPRRLHVELPTALPETLHQ